MVVLLPEPLGPSRPNNFATLDREREAFQRAHLGSRPQKSL